MVVIAEYPDVPFEHHIHGGFTAGQSIHIRGHAKYSHSHNESFAINLGLDPDHHSNIALHVNPRKHPHKVVLNTMVGGEWGHEEKHHNHIHDGEHFHIKIKAHHHHYEVKINDQHVCDYKYRIPAPLVNHIAVEGGVHIDTVELEHHYD